MRINGRQLSLLFADGTTPIVDGIEVRCDSTSIVLDSEPADADLVTFADVLNGNDRRWFITITALPDYADGTFWSLLWATPPFEWLQYRFDPYGVGDLPTPSHPVFTGSAYVDAKPALGGDAGTAWTYDARLTCIGTPTKETGEPIP